MAHLSTTAWVLRELGLAKDFGGRLFGQLPLHAAVHSAELKAVRRARAAMHKKPAPADARVAALVVGGLVAAAFAAAVFGTRRRR